MDADINMNKDPPNAELLILWDLSCPASCRIINISIPRTEWSYLIAFLLTRTLHTRTLLDKSKMTHSMQYLSPRASTAHQNHIINNTSKFCYELENMKFLEKKINFKLLKTIHNYKYVIYMQNEVLLDLSSFFKSWNTVFNTVCYEKILPEFEFCEMF